MLYRYSIAFTAKGRKEMAKTVTNRAVLSRELGKAAGLSYREAALCVDILVEAVAKGGRVGLRGLGSFSVVRAGVKNFPASLSENKIIPAHGRVVFRPSEKLRRAVWNREKV
jgi:nucleoid DNA-binding protein